MLVVQITIACINQHEWKRHLFVHTSIFFGKQKCIGEDKRIDSRYLSLSFSIAHKHFKKLDWVVLVLVLLEMY